MFYTSTNQPSAATTLAEAARCCVADDGGLYLPKSFVQFPRAFFNNLGDMNLRETAFAVLLPFVEGDLPATELKKITDASFSAPAPLKNIGGGNYMLELFHGPTLSFKDYGARFLAQYLQATGQGQRRTVLVASTGNSGAAAANGFARCPGTEVFVLYPKGVLSRMARDQFCCAGPNVHPLEVTGTIEDCKRLVRSAISDAALKGLNVTGANSVNIGRLLPQTVFFFHALGQLLAQGHPRAREAVYSIPCGNLSNLVAGVLALRSGLPAGKLIPVCNVNNPMQEHTGGDAPRPVNTLTPSMDVTVPSSGPRLRSLYSGDRSRWEKEIAPVVQVSDRQTAAAVLRLRAGASYAADSHCAAAYHAANNFRTDAPRVIFATAHPAKNLDIATRITGSPTELPVQLTRFMSGRKAPRIIPPMLPALRKHIFEAIGHEPQQ